MTSATKPNATADDLEVEAEQAFQRASTQQIQNGDDFDFEFESAFQNYDHPSFTSLPTTKSGASLTKDATGSPDNFNGQSRFPVKTEGLPSSLPSSQGWERFEDSIEEFVCLLQFSFLNLCLYWTSDVVIDLRLHVYPLTFVRWSQCLLSESSEVILTVELVKT